MEDRAAGAAAALAAEASFPRYLKWLNWTEGQGQGQEQEQGQGQAQEWSPEFLSGLPLVGPSLRSKGQSFEPWSWPCLEREEENWAWWAAAREELVELTKKRIKEVSPALKREQQ